ncbi:class I poly(R)-hydroxyalkanoic acid synthase [Nitratireductor aquimarinus]|uniref:PHA/PHB synthase family protein n=1 Tax=Nitratireductor TaxID=245876 RepID=UPI000DDEC5F6|nr:MULTISPECIES: class I poly(R)-hydroxyalkanoic acid synthase [Nitratireductor]MBN7759557.1 class I poly(R)-hydroxyalkanoic acid synthase [Nitratireductor aquibiodomus]MBN8244499.1 class I poly(R)-hydroxyalkanoic acid synthase [Nitratireductor aquimarinus]MBY6132887.1 class I poly(R)-hydroxyalkanoic acid synthase [Nitratireductor aquimarinus]MCA1301731.1 class I poly(R)-hydroxyalkanoic acid synthase [Nitratireductor aquimarinus]MDV2964806.1 class I poly(R)-hydroxyalkanoic acid synthase [Nitra
MAHEKQTNGAENQADSTVEQYFAKDPQRFAQNLAQALEELGKAAASWRQARESGESTDISAAPLADMVKTFSRVSEYWLSDPARALEAQTRLFGEFMGIWANAIRRMSEDNIADYAPASDRDKRFQDPEWGRNAFFSFLKQAYLVTARWAADLVDGADNLDEATRHKARFYVEQMSQALSPSNFLLTNPELYRETMASDGENLVRGMRMLAEDIAAGKGDLKLRQSDASKFKVGENIATTPGKVIARNRLVEVLQYEPTTKKAFKRPLLIVPPWINKFYILDLNPKRSFIRWAVEQGHTVFVISWINPDERHACLDWGDYIDEGIRFALDTIEQATGEKQVNAMGYCVGGTLLAAGLALMAAEGEQRIASATFLTTQVDFTFAGDLKVFVDEEQIKALDAAMRERGFLDATRMATAFNMLRAGDLIWPYVVNNYLRGQAPLPFDLLYWNSDSTRLAAANHSYYLRNCYLENNLSQGRAVLRGRTLHLEDVDIPIFNLATREDHIAPAKSVFLGSRFFGGPVEFVLAGSGHIAGVINPPEMKKYQFWSGPKPEGELDDWMAQAKENAGSWWPRWHEWITGLDKEEVKARKPAKGKKALADAPGDYVRTRA